MNATMMALKFMLLMAILLVNFCPQNSIKKDVYGGSFDNRAKLLIDIIDQIKEKTSSSFLIGVRISPEVWPGY